jgi:hypothetical protein
MERCGKQKISYADGSQTDGLAGETQACERGHDLSLGR